MSEPTSIAEVATKVVAGLLKIYSLFDMGKTLIEIYKDKHNTLKNLFIKAFAQAVNNVSKRYENDSIKSFLENCHKIDNIYCCKDLYDYLCRKNNEREILLSDNVIVDISNEITEQLNCIVLNDNEYKNLYNVFSYYQLNNISFKLDEMDNIIQNFVTSMKNGEELKSDNEKFAKAYMERMFMHRVGAISVSLSDIFVMPNVNIEYRKMDALEAIRDFVEDSDKHIFFLEGFGGYGKSSMVSYLAYNYFSSNIDFLNDRQLVIIRLRDIDSSNIIDDINNVNQMSRNAVLIFDGLDELCLIENKSDGNSISEKIIFEFLRDNREIIITSRPTYVKYELLKAAGNVHYTKAELMAFDDAKRQEFVYSFILKDNKNKCNVEYIQTLKIDDNNNSIYGSPFILYLIMSGNIREEEKSNSWKLMHRIFHDEMFNPMYNPGIRNLGEEEIKKYMSIIVILHMKCLKTKIKNSVLLMKNYQNYCLIIILRNM